MLEDRFLSVTMASFSDLTTSDGLKELDEYLLTRSYIDGCVRAPCSPMRRQWCIDPAVAELQWRHLPWRSCRIIAQHDHPNPAGTRPPATTWSCSQPSARHPTRAATRTQRGGSRTSRRCSAPGTALRGPGPPSVSDGGIFVQYRDHLTGPLS